LNATADFERRQFPLPNRQERRVFTAPEALARFTTPLLTDEKGSGFMNKNELITRVAKDAKLTKGEAGEAIVATLANIMKALQRGDDVRLVGFGTFAVTRRKATETRNPQTGKTIKLPAMKRTRFRAGKMLKKAVNA
jgi:DNA-binding protein HU-beta